MKKSYLCLPVLLSSAMLAGGAAYAQSGTYTPTTPATVTTVNPPVVKGPAKVRSEVRAEAQSATRMVPRTGGEVAADAGKPTQADTIALFSTSDKTRDEVRAEARYENKQAMRRHHLPGGEDGNHGRNLYW